NCLISNNETGIEISGPVLPQFPQPNFVYDNDCNIEIWGSEIQVRDEQYWNPTPNGVDCLVRENIRIKPTGKLIIGPGNIFKFDSQRRVLIEGQLIANGTPSNRIVFTSARPAPSPGDWYGLEGLYGPFPDTCIINNCIIEYAGTGFYGGPFKIENSIIKYCSGFGTGGVGVINNCEIHNNQCGIQFWGGYLFINGSIIRNNNFGIFIDYPAFEPNLPYFTIPNQFLNNTFDIYAYAGVFYIRDDRLWRPSLDGIDFYLGGNFLIVDTTGIFRIAPGNRFLMNQGAIFVYGKIIAQGTPDKKIIFTSENQTPHPGDWMHIWVRSQAETSYFSNCIVEYASYGFMGGNFIIDSSIVQHCYIGIPVDRYAEVYNSVISDNIHAGIECYLSDSIKIIGNTITGDSIGINCMMGAKPIITQNAIYNNLKYGVHNEDNNYWIYAEYNWWGDSTGPKDTSSVDTLYNPDGLGDRVSDHVDYEPWLEWPVTVSEKVKTEMRNPLTGGFKIRPNPFQDKLHIILQMQDNQAPFIDAQKTYNINIYDVSGSLIKTFKDIIVTPFSEIVWDGKDNMGRNVPAGVYLCKIEDSGVNHTLKVIKIK
ncbi:MAG: right-handed parallel beta-helix repeat-containing protein, partial [candidate division WOR-3 bacterium]